MGFASEYDASSSQPWPPVSQWTVSSGLRSSAPVRHPHPAFARIIRLTAVFPSSLGLLEGKTLPEVEKKVKLVRSLILVSLDRATHASLGSQRGRRPSLSLVRRRSSTSRSCRRNIGCLSCSPSVYVSASLYRSGEELTAGWNIFLSYQNNINNKRLALAEEALLHAHSTQEAQDAQARIDELEKKKKKIQEGEGGGAVGVATRLSWS